MGQIHRIEYVDDIHGDAAEGPIEFGFDGKVYEIDLNSSNMDKLRDALAPFVECGRVIGRWRVTARPENGSTQPFAPVERKAAQVHTNKPTTTRTTVAASGTGLDKPTRDKIRAWLAGQGLIEPGKRGRLKAEHVELYLQEHGLASKAEAQALS